jgi:hypothetical protein
MLASAPSRAPWARPLLAHPAAEERVRWYLDASARPPANSHKARSKVMRAMPRDSIHFATSGPLLERHEQGDEDPARPSRHRHDPVDESELQRRAPRDVLTALACARALLDELETLVDAGSDERTRSDLVNQVAEYLRQLASTMTRWQTGDK